MLKEVVFGCGNILLGDDGFGPQVIKELQENYSLPDTVDLLDVGTGVREFLFDYLLSKNGLPNHLIVVDAVNLKGKLPGEIIKLNPTQIPHEKIHDFSLHQFPTVNLLQELQTQTEIEVTIVAVQVEKIPLSIMPGLSPEVKKSLPIACQKVVEILKNDFARGPEQ